MLALHQTENGGVSTFKLGQLPKPSITAEEVLIKVHAAGVNPIDIKRNELGIQEQLPAIIGYDVAGVIEQVGENVTAFSRGDRVFGEVISDSLGPKLNGTIAEYCTSPADLIVKIPSGLAMHEAAALPLAVQTAISALEFVGAKAGDRLFTTAGAGGVGIHLLQIAKPICGVAEIATTASSAKHDFVIKHGADKVIDYHKEDAGEVYKGWADVVLDNTGEIEMELKIVKEGGSIVTIVDASATGAKFLILVPSQDKMEKIVELWKEGKLVPVIDTVYPMQDALKAIEHVARGRAKGKVVIRVVE